MCAINYKPLHIRHIKSKKSLLKIIKKSIFFNYPANRYLLATYLSTISIFNYPISEYLHLNYRKRLQCLKFGF